MPCMLIKRPCVDSGLAREPDSTSGIAVFRLVRISTYAIKLGLVAARLATSTTRPGSRGYDTPPTVPASPGLVHACEFLLYAITLKGPDDCPHVEDRDFPALAPPHCRRYDLLVPSLL